MSGCGFLLCLRNEKIGKQYNPVCAPLLPQQILQGFRKLLSQLISEHLKEEEWVAWLSVSSFCVHCAEIWRGWQKDLEVFKHPRFHKCKTFSLFVSFFKSKGSVFCPILFKCQMFLKRSLSFRRTRDILSNMKHLWDQDMAVHLVDRAGYFLPFK